MLLGDIIKQYREEHQMSLQDFANLIHTSRSYIHMLEKNYNPATRKPISPSVETLKSIANAMNTDIKEILKQLDDNQNIYLDEEEYKKQFKDAPMQKQSKIDNNIQGMNKATEKGAVVFVYGTIPAGTPIECIENIIDTEEISVDMLKGGKEYFGLRVKGNSMEPEYLDGDTLILLKQDDCENGDDCVVMVNGQDGTFKRVFKNENGIILQPLNSAYNPVPYTNKEIEELPVRILGVVEEIRRKKKRKK